VQELETQVLDPHFARLLSSLSTSARTAPDNNLVTDETGALLSASLPNHSTDQTRAPFQPSSRSPENHLTFNEMPSVPPHTKSGEVLQPPYAVPAAPLVQESWPLEVLPPATFGTFATEEPSTSSRASSTKQIDPPAPKSRRSTSTADISPYLSRLSEVPALGKRLKQLALLESVADEATKVTPAVDRLPGQTPLLPGTLHSTIPQRRDAAFLPPHGQLDPYSLPHLSNSRPLASAPQGAMNAFHTRPMPSQGLHPNLGMSTSATPLYMQNASSYQPLSAIDDPSRLQSFANQALPPQQPQPQAPELTALPLQSRVQLQHVRDTEYLPFLPIPHLTPSTFPRSYAADSISSKTASSLLSILNSGRGSAVGTNS
jgi:hypothetical protein